jgi:hypothetical protein
MFCEFRLALPSCPIAYCVLPEKYVPLWKGLQPAWHLYPDPSSHLRVSVILTLVKLCDRTHEGVCRIKREAKLPTRVIDVGLHPRNRDHTKEINDNVHLRETLDEQDRYICLSHCWGKVQLIRTLKDNVEDMKNGISFASLPKTYQDAIQITRHLGIRYLWIDSLCIIQDDEDNWEREASQMVTVYGNSYLTIAASSALDSRAGCFVLRTIPEFQSFKLNLSEKDTEHDEIETSVRQKLRQFGGLKWFVGKRINVEAEPILETRAWTFQEGRLPRRVLHLLSDEFVLNCESATCHESGVFGKHNGRIRQLTRDTDPANISDHWRSYVTEYSGRSTTFVKDRFPALSGITHEFHALNQSKYLAGMWRHSILEDLQWHTETETPLSRIEITLDNYLPSWSWASTNGRVAWFSRGGPLGRYETMNEARIGYVNCQPAGINPFGRIRPGFLHISGFMLTATIKYHSPYEAEAIRGESSAYVWPDYDFTKGRDRVEDGTEVVLLLMAQKFIRAIDPENSMLVLRYVAPVGEIFPGVHVYERIGYANCDVNNPSFEMKGMARDDILII